MSAESEYKDREINHLIKLDTEIIRTINKSVRTKIIKKELDNLIKEWVI